VTLDLLPRPRSLEAGEGTVPRRTPETGVDPSLPAEGYRLEISPQRVHLAAADDAGRFYGRATLDQLARGMDGELPVCTITDWPDLPVRGVMLDISRDKVPTTATLEALVDRLASWKVNQLQLYMEHTFAYAGHEQVWAEASPLTAEEVRGLDAFCRQRHVELVPNQNCLGHMGRWLRHERYRPLAVAPDGWSFHGRWRAPTTLDPANPASLALVRELLGQLLPCFTSTRVHVGLDEPFELPPDRIGQYQDFAARIRRLPELDGRQVLMWGDVVVGRDRLGQLPEGVTVCEWGYEAEHPFAERSADLAAATRPFWVCPGTSSWLTVLGRVTNMRKNCLGAATAAADHGAGGLLNTDWGDLGHLQYLPIREPGLAYAAAVSWCREANPDLDLAAALDEHGFDDPTSELGRALLALGDAHLLVTPQFPNLSVLVMHLYFPQLQLGRTFTDGLTTDDLRAVEETIADAIDAVGRARPRRPDGDLVRDEIRTGAALVGLLCRDARARLQADGWLSSVPELERHALAADLEPIIDAHRSLWLARNRPGGLDDSVRWLTHLRECYLTGATEKSWGGW